MSEGQAQAGLYWQRGLKVLEVPGRRGQPTPTSFLLPRHRNFCGSSSEATGVVSPGSPHFRSQTTLDPAGGAGAFFTPGPRVPR